MDDQPETTETLTPDAEQGVFSAAAAAAAKDEAPPPEAGGPGAMKAEAGADAAAEKAANEQKAADDKAAQEKAVADKKAADDAAAAKSAETAAAEKAAADKAVADKAAADKAAADAKTAGAKAIADLVDEAAKAVEAVEFVDPEVGPDAKITAGKLAEEYPGITGYTRAVVAKALELQAARIDALIEQRVAERLRADPTLSEMRRGAEEEQVQSLLDSATQGEDGIANAAEIHKAAMSSDWLSKQPPHIRDMATKSDDPGDVRYILERAARDLKIEIKRGQSEKKSGDNRVLAARVGLRGTGGRTPSRSTGPMSGDEADRVFAEAAQAIREGKDIPGA
jgi:hypothetical protein